MYNAYVEKLNPRFFLSLSLANEEVFSSIYTIDRRKPAAKPQ